MVMEEIMRDARQIKLDIGIGVVFKNSKLVATKYIGSTVTNEEMLDIEKEVMILSAEPQMALPCNILGMIEEDIQPIQSHLGKPHDIVCFVIDVVDAETEERIEEIYNKFQEEQYHINDYIYEGYDFNCFGYVYDNISKYALNEERLEKLNLLKIDSDKFDLEGLINTVKENMADEVEEYLMVMDLRKSKLVDYVFVCSETYEDTEEVVERVIKQNGKIYIPFAKISECNMELEDVISCANGEFIELGESINDIDIDDIVDMGSLNLGCGLEIGILIECDDNKLSFKVVNYIAQTPVGQTLAQVIEETGVFKSLVGDFINKFVN